jgi:hypothetical protein
LAGRGTRWLFGAALRIGTRDSVPPEGPKMESIRFKAEPVEPDFTKAVDFWSQRNGLCRWPLVHTPILDARFCGAPVLCKGAVYCKAHCRMAYRAPEPRKHAA